LAVKKIQWPQCWQRSSSRTNEQKQVAHSIKIKSGLNILHNKLKGLILKNAFQQKMAYITRVDAGRCYFLIRIEGWFSNEF